MRKSKTPPFSEDITCDVCGRELTILSSFETFNLYGKKISKITYGDVLRVEKFDTLTYYSHEETCYGKKDYDPKLRKGDIITVQWPNHSTVYQVKWVDRTNGYYELKYKRKGDLGFRNRRPLPIVELDSKIKIRGSDGMAEAIFG